MGHQASDEIQFPPVSRPGGNYQSLLVRGNIAYVAIQFPIWGNEFRYQGVLGDTLNVEDGYRAFELCAMNVLVQVKEKLGWDKISGLNHFDAYYVATDGWDDAPMAVNGASDMFLRLLGEKGAHTRAIMGVARLPRNFCAGIVCTFTI
jgi:enamine deaminase RidA (YjgF/YER057c/UK114 family)